MTGRGAPRRLRALPAALLILGALPGCTPAKLWRGEPGADVTVLVPGAARARIESACGPPIRTSPANAGVAWCLYEIDGGRPPDPVRACACALVDLMTLCLLETSDEWRAAATAGHGVTFPVIVSYDGAGTALGTFEQFAVLPPDGRVPAGAEPWTPVPRR